MTANLIYSAIGSHARPVLDQLDRLIASRRRAAFHIGDDDTEMRTDEMLLAATISARERVAGFIPARRASVNTWANLTAADASITFPDLPRRELWCCSSMVTHGSA